MSRAKWLFAKIIDRLSNINRNVLIFEQLYMNTVFPLIRATPLDIHIQISASPLISAAPLNTALIKIVTIFY